MATLSSSIFYILTGWTCAINIYKFFYQKKLKDFSNNKGQQNDGQFIEFQSTGEEAKFSKKTIMNFIELVEGSMPEIFNIQNLAIEK